MKHDWNVTPTAARRIQDRLRGEVVTQDDLGEVRWVAGVDAGFEEQGRITRAAAAVLSFPELELRESAVARVPTSFPYVPGLLSFREIPAILEALKQLSLQPDLLLVDGQGYAHPRRIGIASHLGVVTGLPSIGVAKSRLIGDHGPVPSAKGSWTDLTDQGERIGAVLRTRKDVKPLYISIGHRVSLSTAIDYVLRCTPRYRLPETTRHADRLASRRDPY